MSVVQKLRHYYKANGISALHFDCPHYYECKAHHRRLVKATEAFVGKYYEAVNHKLLIVSADPGYASTRKASRHTLAMRRNCEYRPSGNEETHWYWTLRLALEILKPFRVFREDVNEDNFEKVVQYFAHTNSAKCCQNKRGRAQADDILFENCRKFILGEIEIMQPDLILTQGDKAKRVIEENYEDTGDIILGMRKMRETRIISVAGRRVLWINTYHPAQKRSYIKRFDWPKRERYVRLVQGFINSYK